MTDENIPLPATGGSYRVEAGQLVAETATPAPAEPPAADSTTPAPVAPDVPAARATRHKDTE